MEDVVLVHDVLDGALLDEIEGAVASEPGRVHVLPDELLHRIEKAIRPAVEAMSARMFGLAADEFDLYADATSAHRVLPWEGARPKEAQWHLDEFGPGELLGPRIYAGKWDGGGEFQTLSGTDGDTDREVTTWPVRRGSMVIGPFDRVSHRMLPLHTGERLRMSWHVYGGSSEERAERRDAVAQRMAAWHEHEWPELQAYQRRREAARSRAVAQREAKRRAIERMVRI